MEGFCNYTVWPAYSRGINAAVRPDRRDEVREHVRGDPGRLPKCDRKFWKFSERSVPQGPIQKVAIAEQLGPPGVIAGE